MIPEDGEGGIVEGTKEAHEREEKNAFERPGGEAAPRGGMQGQKDRGAGPAQTLERPGTTPVGTPGSGGGVGGVVKTDTPEPPREGGRVQDPKSRNTP
jgi:hypothetical protein